MRTVEFKDILRHAASLSGLDPDNIAAADFGNLRDWISDSLEDSWEQEAWPDLLRIEERYFRALYDAATAYAAKAEVYYPTDKTYYHALRATTGNLPTVQAYWAKSAASYSASDYAAGAAYAVGNQVYYPTSDKYFQCHTASTGNLPTNTSFWGELVPFDRYIAFEQTGKTKIGEVIGAWNKNKRIFTNASELAFELSDVGIEIKEAVVKAWIEFRIRPPRLFGDTFDTTKAYAINEQIYFAAGNNLYDCIVTTSAGDSPTSAATKWSIVEIPYLFKQFLIEAAHAKWLKQDGQHEKFASVMEMASAQLSRAADKLFRQQNQVKRLRVLTR